MRKLVWSAVAALLMATGASAATISTLDQNLVGAGYWGDYSGSSYDDYKPTFSLGQSFTLSEAAYLQDFSLLIEEIGPENPGRLISYYAALYAWNDGLTGPYLFLKFIEKFSGEGLGKETFSFDNLFVEAGEYAVVYASWNYQSDTIFFITEGTPPGYESFFPGGSAFFSKYYGAGLSADDPMEPFIDFDLAFEMNYTPVPVPAGLPLLATGILLFGLVARRRKS